MGLLSSQAKINLFIATKELVAKVRKGDFDAGNVLTDLLLERGGSMKVLTSAMGLTVMSVREPYPSETGTLIQIQTRRTTQLVEPRPLAARFAFLYEQTDRALRARKGSQYLLVTDSTPVMQLFGCGSSFETYPSSAVGPYKKSYRLGDQAEYDSRTLRYTAPISRFGLRTVSFINPYSSAYSLAVGEARRHRVISLAEFDFRNWHDPSDP